MAVNSRSFLSTSFAASLQSSPIYCYAIQYWVVVDSQIFFVTSCCIELNSIRNAFVDLIPYNKTLCNLLRRCRDSKRHKNANLYVPLSMLFILDANCCVRMHFPTEMYPLSCATKKLAYATMQPSSSPQTHPSTKPMIINHFISAFTVRREASASIDVFVLVDVERRPTRIVMWCVFSRARRRIQLHRFRDRCSIKQACIQAESLQWIAVWRPIGRGADMPKIYCAQGMLRIIHTKLAANVAIATSKTESAEKKESVDACWSSLERLYPAVSAAAMADGMVGLSGDGFLVFGLKWRESNI